MAREKQDQDVSARTDDPLIYRFFTEIGIIEQLARNRLERKLPKGMTMAQFVVLQHFARRGGEQTPLSLAKAMQVSKGTMTNTLQKLEKHNFIQIRPDPDDGRGKLVALTPTGRAARDDAVARLMPEMAELEAALAGVNFPSTLPLLQAVREYLDENRE